MWTADANEILLCWCLKVIATWYTSWSHVITSLSVCSSCTGYQSVPVYSTNSTIMYAIHHSQAPSYLSEQVQTAVSRSSYSGLRSASPINYLLTRVLRSSANVPSHLLDFIYPYFCSTWLICWPMSELVSSCIVYVTISSLTVNVTGFAAWSCLPHRAVESVF